MTSASRFFSIHRSNIAHFFPLWLAAVVIVLIGSVLQAAPVVTNLTAAQRAGTKLVDINYDLAAPGMSAVPMRLEVSSDGGTTWTVPVNTVSGDIGNSVTPGTGKAMVWNAGADWPNGYSTQMRFRVTADDGFALIPAGSFTMGVTSGDTSTNASPVTVTLSTFYLQTKETTKAEWDEVRAWGEINGYTDLLTGGSKPTTHPAQNLTWWDAVKYCNARSEKEGLTPVYTVSGAVVRTGTTVPEVNWNTNGYRLPTEAEWEKAARGGVSGKRFPWGTDTISHTNANFRNGGGESYQTGTTGYHPVYGAGTSPVGSFDANGYGLYDMAGNVGEWCWDWYTDSYYTTIAGTTDPRGPLGTYTYRIVRGGGWNRYATDERCSTRFFTTPGAPFVSLGGFRPARSQSNTIMESSAPALDTRGPATDTTPTATSITATGATLGGNVTADGGATITERGVVYSATATNNNPLIGGPGVTKVTAAGAIGVFTASVTGLTQGTGYSYKAYAINSQGTAYTSVATFTTLSTNADLSALILSSGTLSPAFANGTIAYTASVSNATTSINVTPTRDQANATIEARVNTGTYAAVTSGSPSASLPLNVGPNTVDVRVTAQDGATQKTYTVSVTRMVSTDGLVAYYPFNGNAQDESGNNRHGSVVGPMLAADRFGATERAYFFDGVNDHIIVSSRLTSGNPFTWCAWIKPSNSLITQTSGCILSQQNSSTQISPSFGFNYPNGKINFYSYTYKGFYTYSQIRSYWDTSQWMHVVVTSDAGGQRKIFINGSLDGSASGQEFGEQNASFIMGCDIRSGAYTGAFSGLIDDVRVYSRALADAEVTSLYYQERTKLLQKINFAPILDQLTTDSVTLSAEGGESGNPVTFAVTSGPGVISNGNTLTFTDSGWVTITASQLGNAEYLPAQDVSRTFNVKLIPEPDIVVSQAGTILEDGISVVPFSSKLVGQQGQSLNFTITNPGTGELNSLSISKNGANADDFSVSMLNSTSIPRGTSEVTFNVTFSPTGLGTRQAEIHIGSNVIGIKNPFNIIFTGTGLNNVPIINDLINLSTNEDSATTIDFVITDVETEANSLIVSGTSSNTALVPNANIVFGGNDSMRTVTITPAGNQFGSTTITLTVSDGTASASDTFVLTVNPVNDAPFVSDLADQSIEFNQTTRAIAFSVGDVETVATSLTLNGSSSNLALVPSANIVFGGSGVNRTVTVTPAANQSGIANVTITASDGKLSTSKTFVLLVKAPEISVEQMLGFTIADGGSFDFGQVGTSGGEATRSFTIKNTGSSDLTVLDATITGADQSKFKLLNLPIATLVPGESTTLSVQVAGLTIGLKTATLRIATNDLDEAVFDVILFATGVPANLPSVTTSAATGITLDGAILNGSVKANNLERTVFFDYGPTKSYGSSVAALPATVSGNVATNVSASLSNLLPHTSYNFRVRAVSSQGSASGVNVTFTTRNRVPVAQNDEVLALPSAKVVISPLLNDNDEDGDILSLAPDFTQPGNTVGSVKKVGSDLVFTPAAGFTGGSFKYSAVDAFGGKSTATVTLILDDCSLSEDAIIPSNSEPYDIWVSANAPWKASESIPWLSIEPFIESGYVHVIPARNPSSISRTGIIIIGGKTHTVTQNGNELPIAEDDEILALPSAKVIISPLANDYDPENDLLSITTDFTQPGKEAGTLVKVGADLVFTPTASFSGGSFTYVATDPFGGKSNRATVKLTLAECTLGENVTISSDSPPYDLSVSATAPWIAIESIPWLSVEPPAPNATQLRIIPEGNPSKETRTGTVIIGGKTHTVTQTGISLSPVLTTPGGIPNAVIGSNYELAIPTLNGPVTYTALGMPKGLALSNITGRISGVPSVTGVFTITLFAKNDIGSSNPISFDIKVLPFPKGLAGNYSAMIADSLLITDKFGGLMTMSATTTGGVTGTLNIGTFSHSFTGRLKTTVDPLNLDSYQAVFQTTIMRKEAPNLFLSVNLDSSEMITGNLSLLGPEPEIATLRGGKHAWTAQNSMYHGRYTTSLTDDSGLVQGDGFITFTVSQTGAVNWSGQLADGTTISTRSATLWLNGEFPLFALLYGNKGSLNQSLRVYDDFNWYTFADDTKVNGSPHWVKKPQSATTRAYADGFETTLSAVGAKYSAKEMLEQWPPNSFNIAWVGFEGGEVEAVADYQAKFWQSFIVSKSSGAVVARVNTEWEPPNPAGVKLSVNMAQGTFTGSMTLRDPNPFNPSLPLISRSVKFAGVLNFLTGNGTGYLLLPSIAGPPANVTKSPMTSVRVTLEADNN